MLLSQHESKSEPQNQHPAPSTPLRDHIAQIATHERNSGKPYSGIYDYVLRKGRAFNSQPLTPEEQDYLDLSAWRNHKKKQCYQNAQRTALTLPPRAGMTLLYVEGFTDHGFGIGIYHAWLSLNEKVVDTTVRTTPGNSPVMGLIPGGWEYYGVELSPIECFHSQEHNQWTPIIDDWECRWPLLARGTT